MRRDAHPAAVPLELRPAEELLEKYGRWAQDRYAKQRCASAEGQYRPPATFSRDDNDPLVPFMPDWEAMQVQRAMELVPMQWRRVLQAFYIPQRTPWQAVRRLLGSKTWHEYQVAGVREFWKKYCLHYRKVPVMIAPITRD